MARARFSARTHLLGLIAVAVIPVWLFAAYLLVSFALSEQATYRGQAAQLARQAATTVEDAVEEMFIVLDGLSRSVDMSSPDLEALASHAARLVEGTDRGIILRNPDGSVRWSVDRDGREARSPGALSPRERADLARNGRALSDLHVDGARTGIVATRPLAGTQLLLSMTAPAVNLGDALRERTPLGWVIGVADREGTYVTRSERHAEVSGRPGLHRYLDKAVGVAGTFTSVNQFGDTLLAGYYRSPESGWLYGANIDLATVQAPLRRSLFAVLGIASVALFVSLVLAWFVGRRLTNETSRLVTGAIALGSRQTVRPLETRLHEYSLVSDALVRAQQMLSERTSHLEAVLETAPVAVWFTYDPGGREVIRNRYAAELMGLSRDDRTHFGVPDQVIDTRAFKEGKVVGREDRPLTRAMRGEHTDQEEYVYVLPGGAERSLLTSARPILDRAGATIGAVQVSIDITDRKRGEEERKLLTNELNHRVKNNLAVVQSIAQQTIRNSGSLSEAGEVLSARLAALAEAHDILTRASWTDGSLREVVERAVLAQAPSGRVALEGEDVALEPGLVMALTLVLHELTTNAVKYGAFSTESGRLLVAWSLVGTPQALRLEWTESEGPAIREPDRKGFGTRLLERTAKAHGGTIDMAFREAGFRATLTLPLVER